MLIWKLSNLTNRPFKLKKPLNNFSKIKNHNFLLLFHQRKSISKNLFVYRSFNVNLLLNDGLIKLH